MNIYTNPLRNYELVTVPTPAGSTNTKIYFTDQPNLRDKKTVNIVAYSSSNFPTTVDNLTMISQTLLKNCHLVLWANDMEAIRMPLVSLMTTNPNTVSTVNFNGSLPFNGLQIVWEKSYVVQYIGIALAAQQAFAFGIYYQ